MDLKKNVTKNGVDLNEIDVSKLALVDKTNLVDEITKSLEKGINSAFEQATKKLSDKIDDLGDDDGMLASPSGDGKTSRRGSSSGPSSGTTTDPNKVFERRLQLQQKALKNVEKAISLQRKLERDNRRRELEQKSYSRNGLRYAGQMDNLVDEMHSYSPKKLEEARKNISALRTNVKDNTFGEEQKLLTDHVNKVEKALESETRRRNTTLGKIGGFFNKNNINAMSIVGALSSNSPLAGYVAKHAMDTFRKHNEKTQAGQRDSLMIGDRLQKDLPRSEKKEIEDKDVMVSNEALRPHLIGLDQDTRHATIEQLHQSGHITDEQRTALKAELLPSEFAPVVEPLRTAQSGSSAAPSQSPSAAPSANSPERINDWQTYRGATTKADMDEEEKNAWLHHLKNKINDEKDRQEKIHADKKFDRLDPNSDEHRFFGDEDIVGKENYDAPPSGGKYYDRLIKTLDMVPQPRFPGVPMHSENVEPVHMAEAALAGKPDVAHETVTPDSSPERVQSTDAPQDETVQRIERATTQEADGIDQIVGNTSKLEKLAEQQLVELKEISKTLKSQVEDSRLSSDAARRETKDSAGHILDNEYAKEPKKESSGFGGIMKFFGEGILEALGLSKIGGTLKGFFGGEGAAKGAKGTGVFGRMFGRLRGAGNVGEAGAEGGAAWATTAPKWGKVAAGVEEGGGMLGRAGKLLGKAGGFGRLLGKAALPLTVIFAVVDFFQGMVNADKILGLKDGKKLGFMTRVAGGIGGVVKGFVGIIDLITGLVGIKTDIGGFAGRVVGKGFNNAFKMIGLIFKTLDGIVSFVGGVISKFPPVQLLGAAISGIATIVEGIVDVWSDLLDGKNPLETIKKSFSEFVETFSKLFSGWKDRLLTFLHIPHDSPNGGGSGSGQGGGKIGPPTQGTQIDGGAVDKIASAIQKQEGYKPGSLAYRNNNPGNLRFAKQKGATMGDGGFAKFASYEDGLEAMKSQIRLNAARGSDASGKPINTVGDLISSWAPPSENNTKAYIASVEKNTGFSADAQLSSLGGMETPKKPSPFGDSKAERTDNEAKGLAETLAKTDETLKNSTAPDLSKMKPVAVTGTYAPDAAATTKSMGVITPSLTQSQPTKGYALAKASMENAQLQRKSNAAPSAPTVIAPSSKTVNNNNTTVVDLKAKNTESTYQRMMNSMYVPT